MDSSPARNVTVVELSGSLDAANMGPDSDRLAAHLAAGDVWLVVDVERLTFVDSSGLNLLLKTRRRAHQVGGDLVIARPSAFLRKVIATLGLGGVLRLFDTTEEGVRHFATRANDPPR